MKLSQSNKACSFLHVSSGLGMCRGVRVDCMPHMPRSAFLKNIVIFTGKQNTFFYRIPAKTDQKKQEVDTLQIFLLKHNDTKKQK